MPSGFEAVGFKPGRDKSSYSQHRAEVENFSLSIDGRDDQFSVFVNVVDDCDSRRAGVCGYCCDDGLEGENKAVHLVGAVLMRCSQVYHD